MSAHSTFGPAPSGGAPVLLDIYGYEAEIRGSSAEVAEYLAADFAHFRCESVRQPVRVELCEQPPPYDSLPPVRATVYSPRNVSFRDGPLTYVDYTGRALAIHDRRTGSLRVYSSEREMLYEAAYLFLLSQSADFLDARHLHRVHALGLSFAGRAVLALLPMGGGKSTLGAELLRYPELKLLSDDAPLVDARGRIHALPLRLALLPGGEGQIPESELRRINRLFGPKVLVSYRYFADRVAAEAEPWVIFLGSRSLARDCQIRPASRMAALRSLVANCVVGVGLFQGLEYLLQRSPLQLGGQAGVAFSRLRNCLRLLGRSACYRLVLGRDIEENGRTVMEFLRRTCPGGA